MDPLDLGIVGLGVMGENLARNLDRHGFAVGVVDRAPGRAKAFVAGLEPPSRIREAGSLQELAARLVRPRKVVLLVPAGPDVDGCVAALLPHLEDGDVLVDAGNSHYEDTARRIPEAEAHGVLYVGAGVSGGARGALQGPSIMPGGSPGAWPLVKGILQTVAALAPDGTPCCDWVGPGASGHFVKIVHNGIEYAEMQLLCEAFHLMERVLGMEPRQAGEVFDGWNRGPLESYLVRVTAAILSRPDPLTGQPLVRCILDEAGQKGTGAWAVRAGLELGVPVPTIAAAVFARSQSARRPERLRARALPAPGEEAGGGDRREPFLRALHDALLASRLAAFAQGVQLMQAGSAKHAWGVDLGGVCGLWREGCIIRSRMLERVREAYVLDPGLPNLLLDPASSRLLLDCLPGWRSAVASAVGRGVPVPALSSALGYHDTLRCTRLPANLLQAQRDCFGAHGYERTDRPPGERHHTDWNDG